MYIISYGNVTLIHATMTRIIRLPCRKHELLYTLGTIFSKIKKKAVNSVVILYQMKEKINTFTVITTSIFFKKCKFLKNIL